jgi:hypothetical protein
LPRFSTQARIVRVAAHPRAALRRFIVDAVFIGSFIALLLAMRALIAGCAALERKK